MIIMRREVSRRLARRQQDVREARQTPEQRAACERRIDAGIIARMGDRDRRAYLRQLELQRRDHAREALEWEKRERELSRDE